MGYKLLYIILLTGLLFAACSRENGMEPVPDDRPIVLSFSVDDFIHGANFKGIEADGNTFRATDDGSTSEQDVNNLYLFLFDNTGANPVKYYIDAATFSGGTWVNSASEKKITLNLTQAEAGERQVHIIANCADLRAQLDGVTTVAGLKTVFRNTAQPWSTDINTPILMAGSATHNFITQGHQLNSVHLIRAIAKIELNVTLTSGFQVVPTITSGNLAEYRYRFLDFDTHTYVEKPMPSKPNNLVSSSADDWPVTGSWTPWGASLNGSPSPDTGTGYILDGEGKVTGLKLITYLNERDEAGAAVEIELPRVDSGPLPPPEFGPELYRLPLPEKIERNTWYKYDVDI
jgi:hypothetical protein